MEYTAAEIKRRFKEMNETEAKKVKILAELNGCKEKVIRDVLAGVIGDKELAEIKPTPLRLPPEATRIRAKVTKTEPKKPGRKAKEPEEIVYGSKNLISLEENTTVAEPEEIQKPQEEDSLRYALKVLYNELDILDAIIKGKEIEIKEKEADIELYRKRYRDIVDFLERKGEA